MNESGLTLVHEEPASAVRSGEAIDGAAFAAVDLGATTGRVLLAIPSKGILRVVHRFSNRPLGHEDSLHWNTDVLFRETIEGLRRAHRSARELGVEIAGIGVDAWGVDYGLISNGRLIAPVRHYRRARAEAMRRDLELMDGDRLYAITGVLEQPMNTLFQLSDDRRNGLLGAAEQVLQVPDLWIYWLTGAVGTEPTIASTTQLFDPWQGTWSEEVMGAFDLPRTLFPEVHATGSMAGVTTETITIRIGALRPVPVFRVGAHDTASAFWCAKAVSPHSTALVSSGSWTLVGSITVAPIVTPDSRADGFTNEQATDGQNLHIKNLNGLWLLEECIRERYGRVARPDMAELMSHASDVSNPARFDLQDRALFAPRAVGPTIDRLCSEAGFAAPTDLPRRARAIVESIAFGVGRAISASGSHSQASIVGGGSRNTLLCQLIAEYSSIPVIAGHTEAAALGNVFVQANASGLNLDDVVARYAEDSITTYYPDGPVEGAPYDRRRTTP